MRLVQKSRKVVISEKITITTQFCKTHKQIGFKVSMHSNQILQFKQVKNYGLQILESKVRLCLVINFEHLKTLEANFRIL